MVDYLRRLLRTGAAYQAADLVSKPIALVLLPLYTRHLTRADYGTAELLIATVILVSILVRFGIVEAYIRFHYDDRDPGAQQRLARLSSGFLLATTTGAALAATVLAGPLSELLLGFHDPWTMRIAVLGLWAFTNLELAYAMLRVREAARRYLAFSLTNVALTVALTVWLVVFMDAGARGLLAGNFCASTVVLAGLWWSERGMIGLRPVGPQLGTLLRFGVPIIPAEMSVFALNVVDRLYLYRVESEEAAGLYSLSVKLAAIVVFTVRAFQYAWPPLAYSITDDSEARRVYAQITTYYVLATGLVVAAIALLGRWVVRLFAAPEFFESHEALGWVALGWALYGLFLILVVLAGRAKVTTRNFPAAIVGLAVNVALLVVLVPPLGIAGAGISLVGAYIAMLVVMYFLTRGLFAVAFEWARLARIVAVLGAVVVAAELTLPTEGLGGLLARSGAVAAMPALLAATGFFRRTEIVRARELARRGTQAARGRRRPDAEEEAVAVDPAPPGSN